MVHLPRWQEDPGEQAGPEEGEAGDVEGGADRSGHDGCGAGSHDAIKTRSSCLRRDGRSTVVLYPWALAQSLWIGSAATKRGLNENV